MSRFTVPVGAVTESWTDNRRNQLAAYQTTRNDDDVETWAMTYHSDCVDPTTPAGAESFAIVERPA